MPARDVLSELWEVIGDRVANPREGSYISSLLRDRKGIDRVLEKVGEESTEYIIAVKNGRKEDIVMEAADLQFHLLVSLKAAGIEFSEVLGELESRRR
ncbi:MAG: phosphoribosyl-ATP pyrophosphatase [Methanoregulaceae archaeon PtaB.Bin108]|nr:MAG: phosphoribosyl-ATP pyrophosphatase [Methanoregulaceae archaeon PtaB.Bin108]